MDVTITCPGTVKAVTQNRAGTTDENGTYEVHHLVRGKTGEILSLTNKEHRRTIKRQVPRLAIWTYRVTSHSSN